MIIHLKAFLQFLKLNRGLSPHTVRAYESDLSQFIAHAAAAAGVKRSELDPAQLDRAALGGFIAEIHRLGESRATAARKLAAVRTFLRYLRREDVITSDPGALVSTPKREVRMPAHLSEDEMMRLIAAADDSTPLGRRDRAILELFYASGLRLSELTGLDIGDVNLNAKMVRVLGKGGKQRIVPFNGATADAIRAVSPRPGVVGQRRSGQPPPPRLRRSAEAGREGGSRTLQRTLPQRRRPAWRWRSSSGCTAPGSAVRELSRWAADRAQRRSARAPSCGVVQHAARHQSARVAALVRYAPPAPWRRPARHSGNARAREPEHHAALHARQRGAVAGRVPEGASEGRGLETFFTKSRRARRARKQMTYVNFVSSVFFASS